MNCELCQERDGKRVNVYHHLRPGMVRAIRKQWPVRYQWILCDVYVCNFCKERSSLWKINNLSKVLQQLQSLDESRQTLRRLRRMRMSPTRT